MAIDERALDASRQGGPLRPDDEVQVAGLGREIFELMRGMADTMRAAPKTAKPMPEGTPAVPTRDEERMLEPEIDSYRQRQEQVAPKLLSEEGQKRFEESGFSAEKALQPKTTVEKAQEALGETELVQKPAQQNLRYIDKDTGELRAGATDKGAASEIDAADLQRTLQRQKVEGFVKSSDDGIDFNFDKLETGDDVKSLFDHVSELHAPGITDAKRGKIANPETLDQASQLLADELGFTRELLKKRKGGMLNAAQMTAARKLMVRSGERLLNMANKITDNKNQNIIDKNLMVQFRRQMVIHSGIQMQVKSAQTEIARALQAFNIPVGADDAMRSKITDEILEITGGDKSGNILEGGTRDVEKVAEALIDVHNTGGATALHKYAESIGRRGTAAFHEAYVNGLLSWTKTHVKNFLATPMFMGWQLAEEVAAGVYGSVERTAQRALGREVTADGVYVGQAFARMFGMTGAIRDAWVTAGQTFRTEMPTSALNKVEAGQFRSITAENLGVDPLASPNLAKFVDALGKGIRIPGRALMGADDFWRVIGMRGELYAESYNQGMKSLNSGKKVQAAKDDAAMVLLDPRTFQNELDATASYSTLTTELNTLGNVTRLVQRVPFFGKLLMPFVKAPTNAIIRVIERLHPFHKGAFSDPKTRQKMMGRLSITWGAMYQFHNMAVNGRLTGAMPSEEKQRRLLPPGWQPYSMVFKGDTWPKDEDGDDLPIFDPVTGAANGPLTYVSYQGLEPVGAMLGIAASTAEGMRRSNDPVKSLSLVTNAVGAAFNYVKDMPMLKSVGDVVKAFEYNNASFIARSPLQSALPYSSAVRAIEKAVDPVQRKPSATYSLYTLQDVQNSDIVPFQRNDFGKMEPRYDLVGLPKGGVENALTASLSELESIATERPLLGFDEKESGIQYDIMGRPRETNVRFDVNPIQALNNLILPFNVSKGKKLTLAEREHIRLGAPLRFNRNQLQGVRLTEAMMSQWTNAAKNEVTIFNNTQRIELPFRPALDALVSSKNYLGADDSEKRTLITNLEDSYYDEAVPILLSKNPDLHQIIIDKESMSGM